MANISILAMLIMCSLMATFDYLTFYGTPSSGFQGTHKHTPPPTTWAGQRREGSRKDPGVQVMCVSMCLCRGSGAIAAAELPACGAWGLAGVERAPNRAAGCHPHTASCALHGVSLELGTSQPILPSCAPPKLAASQLVLPRDFPQSWLQTGLLHPVLTLPRSDCILVCYTWLFPLQSTPELAASQPIIPRCPSTQSWA